MSYVKFDASMTGGQQLIETLAGVGQSLRSISSSADIAGGQLTQLAAKANIAASSAGTFTNAFTRINGVLLTMMDRFAVTRQLVSGFGFWASATAIQVGHSMQYMSRHMIRGFESAGRSAGEFEAHLREVGTIANYSAEQMRFVRHSLQGLSSQYNKTTSDLAEGAYQILSSSLVDPKDPKEALGFLEEATKLSVAGVSTTEDAVNALAVATNVFGNDLEDAGELADTFFEGVRLGFFTVKDIPQFLGRAAFGAQRLGLGPKDLMGLFAATTIAGQRIRLSGMNVSRMLQSINEGLTDGTKAAARYDQVFTQLGITWDKQELRTGRLVDLFEKLNELGEKSPSGLNTALLDLFPEAAGRNAAAAMSSRKMIDIYRSALSGASEGSVDRAMEIILGADEAQIQRARGVLVGIAQEIGQAYNKIKSWFANAALPILKWIRSLLQHSELFRGMLVGLGVVFAGMLAVLGNAIFYLGRLALTMWHAGTMARLHAEHMAEDAAANSANAAAANFAASAHERLNRAMGGGFVPTSGQERFKGGTARVGALGMAGSGYTAGQEGTVRAGIYLRAREAQASWREQAAIIAQQRHDVLRQVVEDVSGGNINAAGRLATVGPATRAGQVTALRNADAAKRIAERVEQNSIDKRLIDTQREMGKQRRAEAEARAARMASGVETRSQAQIEADARKRYKLESRQRRTDPSVHQSVIARHDAIVRMQDESASRRAIASMGWYQAQAAVAAAEAEDLRTKQAYEESQAKTVATRQAARENLQAGVSQSSDWKWVEEQKALQEEVSAQNKRHNAVIRERAAAKRRLEAARKAELLAQAEFQAADDFDRRVNAPEVETRRRELNREMGGRGRTAAAAASGLWSPYPAPYQRPQAGAWEMTGRRQWSFMPAGMEQAPTRMGRALEATRGALANFGDWARSGLRETGNKLNTAFSRFGESLNGAISGMGTMILQSALLGAAFAALGFVVQQAIGWYKMLSGKQTEQLTPQYQQVLSDIEAAIVENRLPANTSGDRLHNMLNDVDREMLALGEMLTRTRSGGKLSAPEATQFRRDYYKVGVEAGTIPEGTDLWALAALQAAGKLSNSQQQMLQDMLTATDKAVAERVSQESRKLAEVAAEAGVQTGDAMAAKMRENQAVLESAGYSPGGIRAVDANAVERHATRLQGLGLSKEDMEVFTPSSEDVQNQFQLTEERAKDVQRMQEAVDLAKQEASAAQKRMTDAQQAGDSEEKVARYRESYVAALQHAQQLQQAQLSAQRMFAESEGETVGLKLKEAQTLDEIASAEREIFQIRKVASENAGKRELADIDSALAMDQMRLKIASRKKGNDTEVATILARITALEKRRADIKEQLAGFAAEDDRQREAYDAQREALERLTAANDEALNVNQERIRSNVTLREEQAKTIDSEIALLESKKQQAEADGKSTAALERQIKAREAQARALRESTYGPRRRIAQLEAQKALGDANAVERENLRIKQDQNAEQQKLIKAEMERNNQVGRGRKEMKAQLGVMGDLLKAAMSFIPALPRYTDYLLGLNVQHMAQQRFGGPGSRFGFTQFGGLAPALSGGYGNGQGSTFNINLSVSTGSGMLDDWIRQDLEKALPAAVEKVMTNVHDRVRAGSARSARQR